LRVAIDQNGVGYLRQWARQRDDLNSDTGNGEHDPIRARSGIRVVDRLPERTEAAVTGGQDDKISRVGEAPETTKSDETEDPKGK
jgi:hypothetical protein